jgi:hypothetical protein
MRFVPTPIFYEWSASIIKYKKFANINTLHLNSGIQETRTPLQMQLEREKLKTNRGNQVFKSCL